MSERDINPRSGTDLPSTTGEFRATPDISASTAQFRAFADSQQRDAEHSWSMRAPGRNVAALAAIIIVVAVVLIVLAIVVLGH